MSDNQTPNADQTQGQPLSDHLDFSPLVKDGKILGKYETPEAAAEGYWNAVQEMNAAKQQLNTAVEVIRALQAGQPQQMQQTQPAYETQLSGLGIPLDALSQLVEAKASQIAGKLIQQQFTPLVEGANARSQMAASYPDFLENESAIFSAIKRDNTLASRFEELLKANRPYDALELGYFKWKMGQQPKVDPVTENARRAASMVPQGQGVNRTSGIPTGPTEQQVNEAYAAYAQGDARPLFDLKFKNVPITYSEQMEALARGQRV